MLTRAEAVAACMTLADAFEDYPFHDENWTVMRHKTNKKCFAMIFMREGKIWINVKAEPLRGDFLKDAFPAVIAGYHCNKRHWLSIILDGSMSDEEIMTLIRDSYELTQNKVKGTGAR